MSGPPLLGAFEVLERVEGGPGEGELLLRVPPAEHAVFEGHFPGDPLLPAWVQLALVQQIAAEARGVLAVRFRGAVRPGDTLRVKVDGGRFAVSTDAGPAASGRLAQGDA